jgi:F-type H+-transporting ATPase subunit b
MVAKAMEDRTQKIRENLDDAERTKAEAQRILEEYQRQLADAKNESARIIDEARQTAEQMRRDLMVRAEAEVGELRDRSRV